MEKKILKKEELILKKNYLVQLPGGSSGAHHIIPALYNVNRNVQDFVNILQDKSLLQEYSVDKVVALDPGKGCSKVQVVSFVHVLGVW